MGDFFISIENLKRLIGTPEAPIIIDACRSEVYAERDRVLPTALWRDHAAVERWASEFDANARVVVYCVHGHNVSQHAVAVLRRKGINAQALAGGVEGWIGSGGTTIRKAALAKRNQSETSYWVTRLRPKIDRVACPWLITRFIDRAARFHFVEAECVQAVAAEMGGTPFDVAGASFGHGGDNCTFDSIIEAFEIDDPALTSLRSIVRGADTQRFDLAPEAMGLSAISSGLSAMTGGNDHAMLRHGFAIYDALYASKRLATPAVSNLSLMSSPRATGCN